MVRIFVENMRGLLVAGLIALGPGLMAMPSVAANPVVQSAVDPDGSTDPDGSPDTTDDSVTKGSANEYHAGSRPEPEYVAPWQADDDNDDDQQAPPVIKAQDDD